MVHQDDGCSQLRDRINSSKLSNWSVVNTRHIDEFTSFICPILSKLNLVRGPFSSLLRAKRHRLSEQSKRNKDIFYVHEE